MDHIGIVELRDKKYVIVAQPMTHRVSAKRVLYADNDYVLCGTRS